MTPSDQLSPGNRIMQFIQRERVWFIGEGRVKARQACIEFLQRAPVSVRNFIIKEKRLLLIAPPFGIPGMVNPYQVGLDGRHEEMTRFSVIYLDSRLEALPVVASVVTVAKCVANALQAARGPGDSVRAVAPEELLMMWGFTEDLAKARRARTPERISNSERAANLAEIVN